MIKENKEYSSFRDPAGYIFYQDDKIYRKINKCYFKEYDHFIKSGLYEELKNSNLIVKHQEIKKTKDYILLEVEKIPFISYPYEWCFEAYKQAALLTLKINKIALKYGMILKDATAYNIQFINTNPILIDTLSFKFYKEEPWLAYGQFTRHFIAPLALMYYVDYHLNVLLKNYIDGIPLDVAANILGKRGGFFSKQHIKWQNKMILKHNEDGKTNLKQINITKKTILNILTMLEVNINKLKYKYSNSEWLDYYHNTNYDNTSSISKKSIINSYLENINFKREDFCYDLGANDGKYSRLLKLKCQNIIALDIDINVTNKNYEEAILNNEPILPLVFDLNNPSPAIGFANNERLSLEKRGKSQLMLALALIHHLAISNNLSFDMIAKYFANLTKYLIIEFIPKDDSQVQILLKTREDIFKDYNEKNFINIFSKYFKIIKKDKIKNSKRILYLMVKI